MSVPPISATMKDTPQAIQPKMTTVWKAIECALKSLDLKSSKYPVTESQVLLANCSINCGVNNNLL